MGSYGELLDSNINLDKLSTYTLFSAYFNNPRMSLLREDGSNVVYCCKVRCGLSRQKRYIIAIVPKDGYTQYAKTASLSDLYWSILQTRTLDEDQVVPVHFYTPKDDNHNIIKIKQKTSEKFIYSCTTFPITVSLIITKTQMQPYSDSGTLGLALETYNCVVHLSS